MKKLDELKVIAERNLDKFLEDTIVDALTDNRSTAHFSYSTDNEKELILEKLKTANYEIEMWENYGNKGIIVRLIKVDQTDCL
jgi:hypothetical protein